MPLADESQAMWRLSADVCSRSGESACRSCLRSSQLLHVHPSFRWISTLHHTREASSCQQLALGAIVCLAGLVVSVWLVMPVAADCKQHLWRIEGHAPIASTADHKLAMQGLRGTIDASWAALGGRVNSMEMDNNYIQGVHILVRLTSCCVEYNASFFGQSRASSA